MTTPNTRRPNESYKAYRARLKRLAVAEKQMKRGRLLWRSRVPVGVEESRKWIGRTYVRAQHGPLQ